MADDAYNNAIVKRDRLLKELEEVNNFLKMYHRFAPKAPAKSEGTPMAAPDPGGFAPVRREQTGKRVSVPERFAPIIRGILLREGRPISRATMLKMLEDNGTPIPGQNPAKNLGTIMWRLPQLFTNIEGFGYWLKGVLLPNLNYMPVGGFTLEDARALTEAGVFEHDPLRMSCR